MNHREHKINYYKQFQIPPFLKSESPSDVLSISMDAAAKKKNFKIYYLATFCIFLKISDQNILFCYLVIFAKFLKKVLCNILKSLRSKAIII